MGLPPEKEFMGKSFMPELFGAQPDNREPIICELTEDSHNPPRRAVILGDYKLIVIKERKFQLYNLKTDPGEEKDLAKTEPDRFTINSRKNARGGKIFLDYLRNDETASAVAAYSVRARPGAPVSVPLAWDELAGLRSGSAFSIDDVLKRRKDPWKDMTGAARQRLP